MPMELVVIDVATMVWQVMASAWQLGINQNEIFLNLCMSVVHEKSLWKLV